MKRRGQVLVRRSNALYTDLHIDDAIQKCIKSNLNTTVYYDKWPRYCRKVQSDEVAFLVVGDKVTDVKYSILRNSLV